MPVRRGIYYTQDSMDNWRLAKCHTKSKKTRWSHKHLYTGGFSLVKPEEVLEKLQEMGIKRDKRTLQRYAKMELVPKPEIINLGRGAGKISDYPESTPYEFYAGAYLKQFARASFDEIKKARDLVKEFEARVEEDPSILESQRIIPKKGEHVIHESDEEFERYRKRKEISFILDKHATFENYLFRKGKSIDYDRFNLAKAWFILSQGIEGGYKDIFRKMMDKDNTT